MKRKPDGIWSEPTLRSLLTDSLTTADAALRARLLRVLTEGDLSPATVVGLLEQHRMPLHADVVQKLVDSSFETYAVLQEPITSAAALERTVSGLEAWATTELRLLALVALQQRPIHLGTLAAETLGRLRAEGDLAWLRLVTQVRGFLSAAEETLATMPVPPLRMLDVAAKACRDPPESRRYQRLWIEILDGLRDDVARMQIYSVM